jgi:histidyl-tRNA synthetase
VELKIDAQVAGTRILARETAVKHRFVINTLVGMALEVGAEEVVLPMLEPVAMYPSETIRHTYTFQDREGHPVCVRPFGMTTCQLLGETVWKGRRNVLVFYVARCWRFERPQLGHHHEFTDFGIEVLNPHEPIPEVQQSLRGLAVRLVERFTKDYEVVTTATGALSPYEKTGFQILSTTASRQQKAVLQANRNQLCYGGTYNHGAGFVISVDRLMLVEFGKVI